MKYRWKFLREGLKSEANDYQWRIKKWEKHVGEVKLCNFGFHCSKKIWQAFSYVRGEILAKVEVGGESKIQDDKEVYSEMRIVKAYKWQKRDNVALAIYSAELVLKNFEKEYPKDKRPRKAIESAKRWLKNPTEKNRSAARLAASAAWSAARLAARLAARSAASAARLAARSAASAAESAESAARLAAWSAESVAESTIVLKISKWMDKRVKKLEEIKN